MPPKIARVTRFAALAVLVGLAAGQAMAGPSMKLSPDLAQVTAQPVLGRTHDIWRRGLEFADWRARAPKSFDPRNWSWDVPLGESHGDEELRVDISKVAFGFDLDSADVTASTQCLAQGRFAVHTRYHGRVEDETTVTLPGYPRIDCKLAGARGMMSLRPDFLTQRDSGLLRFAERSWNVQSVNNLASQRSSFPLARFGYEISSGGKVVAAVETAGKGRVWFSPALADDEREELAEAMSALLYYATILEDEDR